MSMTTSPAQPTVKSSEKGVSKDVSEESRSRRMTNMVYGIYLRMMT